MPSINDLCPVCGGALASAGQHDAGPFCGCAIVAREAEREKRRAAVRGDVARASGETSSKDHSSDPSAPVGSLWPADLCDCPTCGADLRKPGHEHRWAYDHLVCPSARGSTQQATSITIRGRKYTVEVLPPDSLNPTRPSYRITGTRNAKYYTVRNRPHPELMFLIREGSLGQGALGNVWLTDKDGTLQEARR